MFFSHVISLIILLCVQSAVGFIDRGFVEASDIRYYIMLLFRGLIYPLLESFHHDNTGYVEPAPYLLKAVTFPLHILLLRQHQGYIVYDIFCIVEIINIVILVVYVQSYKYKNYMYNFGILLNVIWFLLNMYYFNVAVLVVNCCRILCKYCICYKLNKKETFTFYDRTVLFLSY